MGDDKAGALEGDMKRQGGEALLRLAIQGKAGLLWQLGASVTEDGLWYEGTMAYHFYAVQAIVRTLEAAARAGLDFSGNTRLKSLWLGPLQRLTQPRQGLP